MKGEQKYIEEILNSTSHGIAAIASIIGFIALIIFSSSNQDWILFSTIVYGLSLIILYTSSALYHGLKNKKIKHIFRILDHCSIFILIAGTYTPVLLISIGGSTGWWLFGIQWTLVLMGFIFKIFYTGKYESISILIYIIMGWMIIFKWNHLTNAISDSAFNLLLAGGIVYTMGIFFYLLDSKIKYFHFIWHLFVITGSILHYTMVYKYIIN
jgi:hemolysin III|tara:strand:+ start:186 stop:821 length:636 start_codon:yes stop_codon:yes gene_type:complete